MGLGLGPRQRPSLMRSLCNVHQAAASLKLSWTLFSITDTSEDAPNRQPSTWFSWALSQTSWDSIGLGPQTKTFSTVLLSPGKGLGERTRAPTLASSPSISLYWKNPPRKSPQTSSPPSLHHWNRSLQWLAKADTYLELNALLLILTETCCIFWMSTRLLLVVTSSVHLSTSANKRKLCTYSDNTKLPVNG